MIFTDYVLLRLDLEYDYENSELYIDKMKRYHIHAFSRNVGYGHTSQQVDLVRSE